MIKLNILDVLATMLLICGENDIDDVNVHLGRNVQWHSLEVHY